MIQAPSTVLRVEGTMDKRAFFSMETRGFTVGNKWHPSLKPVSRGACSLKPSARFLQTISGLGWRGWTTSKPSAFHIRSTRWAFFEKLQAATFAVMTWPAWLASVASSRFSIIVTECRTCVPTHSSRAQPYMPFLKCTIVHHSFSRYNHPTDFLASNSSIPLFSGNAIRPILQRLKHPSSR